MVLLRGQRKHNGFIMVLLRGNETTMFVQWFCFGVNEKHWFDNGLLRGQRKSIYVIVVLLRGQRKSNGFTLVLLRGERKR